MKRKEALLRYIHLYGLNQPMVCVLALPRHKAVFFWPGCIQNTVKTEIL